MATDTFNDQVFCEEDDNNGALNNVAKDKNKKRIRRPRKGKVCREGGEIKQKAKVKNFCYQEEIKKSLEIPTSFKNENGSNSGEKK